MSVAFLFPGQGAQHPDFLHALPDHAAIRTTLREASERLDRDVLTFDSEAALRSTVNVQLALLIAGVATARMLQAEGITPQAVSGLSAGAFGAAVISGALTFADSLRLVHQRATLMEHAFPSGYGLSAIVGLTESQVAALVSRVHSHESPVFVANINAPRQLVIAGADAAMQRVVDDALARGARKAERLPVAVPSHCPLLATVAQALRATLRDIPREPASAPRAIIPYVGNVRARVLRSADAIADDAAGNIAHGVRWHDATVALTELGCRLFIELSPGHVLTDLATDAFPDVRSVPLDSSSLAHLRQLIADMPRQT